MGTPDFALPALRALVQSEHKVIAAITQPDRPKGRGHHLMPPPVKAYALEQNIPVYQPATLKGEEFATLLSELDPDLIVVVAFGKILPQSVLDYPKYGCVNMLMAAGLDTGDMLLRGELRIGENDNFEDIHDGLASLGADLLIKTVAGLESGEIKPEAQDDSLATYAAKIEKSDCLLDFSKDAKTLHDLIRGLSPIPLAFTHTPDGKLMKIVESRVYDAEKTVKALPGTVFEAGEDIKIVCGKGILSILTLVPEGKGRMSAGDFVRGRKIAAGDLLK